jgi:hypothetical protein
MARRAAAVLAGVMLMLSAIGCSIDLGPLEAFDLETLGFKAVTGDGNVVTQGREVGGFDSVALSGWGKLHIELGDTEALTIEADQNLLEYIEAEVTDGHLEIRHRRRVVLRPSTPINYYLTVTALESVRVTGAGEVEVPALSGERFSVFISGAGKIDMADMTVDRLRVDITGAGDVSVGSLTGDRLDVEISGAGDFSVEGGEIREQDIGISGGGNHQARELQSAEASIRLSGLGNATVRVSERLEVSISGAGSVRYIGDPTVEKNVSGVGSVKQIQP